MKYFLGYYYNNEYQAIKDSNIGTSILDVVNFTTGFVSLDALRRSLCDKDLIPHTHCKLAYVIEKGPKDNKSYSPLKRIDNIYLAPHKEFFSTTEVYNSLKSLEHDFEFMTYLYSEYMRLFGIDNKIKYFLEEVTGDKQKIRIVIRQLCLALNSGFARSILSRIVDELDKDDEEINEVTLHNEMKDLIEFILSDQVSLTNAAICLIKFIEVNRIPTLIKLNAWLNKGVNQSYDIRVDGSDEAPSVDSDLDVFYNEVLYDFDYEKREYKKVNGKRKLKERSFFDLCSIIADYHIMLYKAYTEVEEARSQSISSLTLTNDDEYEEFLEEEDFARLGTTSEEAGIRLRPNTHE